MRAREGISFGKEPFRYFPVSLILSRVEELSPKMLKNVHGILPKAIDLALKLRYIGLNPADACTLPCMEKKQIKPLAKSEIIAFMGEIQIEFFARTKMRGSITLSKQHLI